MTKEKTFTYRGFIRSVLRDLVEKQSQSQNYDKKYNLSQESSELIEELVRLSLDRLTVVLNMLRELSPHATLKDRDTMTAMSLIFGDEASKDLRNHVSSSINKFTNAREHKEKGHSQNRRMIAGIHMPIARTAAYVHNASTYVRMSELSRISVAAFTDYVVIRLLTRAMEMCNRTRINVINVNRGISSDTFLGTLFEGTIIAGGGPHQLPKSKKAKAKARKVKEAPPPETEAPPETKTENSPETANVVVEPEVVEEKAPTKKPKASAKKPKAPKSKGRAKK